MRHALAPAALVLLSVHVPAFAQVGPDIRFVTAAEAQVRAGNGDSQQFYPTNRLQRGAKVEVIQELPGGWLKIVPPHGSFSYISTRNLEHISPNQPNYVVALPNAEVPVFIGSEVVNQRPTIVGCKLKCGAQVVSIGKAMSENGEPLMPIEPPPGEGRYIRADAVARTPPGTGAFVTAAGGAGAAAAAAAHSSFTPSGPLTASNAPSANPPVSPYELWQRAMNAQRAGQTADAIRLFNQVAYAAADSDPRTATYARQWVEYLQYGHQAYGAGGSVPANPVSRNGVMAGRSYALGADAAGAVRLNAPTGSRTAWTDPANVQPTGGTSRNTSGQLPAGWVAFRGRLRPAGRAVEGIKTYVIEMEEQGYVRPVAYVGAGPGIDLASQVGRVVEVSGPAHYRGDIRTNYMTAMRLTP
jgi:hypothetical protein